MRCLAILGASGHGKVLADAALLCGWETIVFFDDAWPNLSQNSRWPVIGNTDGLMAKVADFDGVIVAIGNNQIRLSKSNLLVKFGANLITLIHPSAVVSPFASVGRGGFIAAAAILQVDSCIGDACIINTNAVVEHDCDIADGVHVSPSAVLAGAVNVGELSWVGAGASIKQLVNIGSGVTVGAGAVVICNVADGNTVVGNPARELLKN